MQAKNRIAIAGMVAGIALLSAAVALAAPPTDTGSTAAGLVNRLSGRLSPLKLRACQARENAIKTRSAHIADLANTIEEKFAGIAQRVENYYANTVVSAGKSVSDYDALAADIAAKKNAVSAAVAQGQQDAGVFSCGSSDPKQQLIRFRNDMQAAKQALKEYRTAIKNLIVAIHGVDQQSGQGASTNTSNQ